jgi:hypothetical protein
MIIYDLDLLGPLFAPPEYDPPLIIDSDRIPAGKIASQRFQAISRRRGEIAEYGRVVELHQLAASYSGNVRRKSLWDASLLEDQLGERATETSDHRPICIMA